MKPLVIYEYTSSINVTFSFDNSIYDGGMPILYYNIYLDKIIKTVKMLFLLFLKEIKVKLLI